MSFLYRAKSYIKHWLLEVDEHSVHSPFFFDFYRKVIRDSEGNPQFTKLEKLRTDLLSNSSLIEVESNEKSRNSGQKRSKQALSEIASSHLTDQNYCELYHRILKHLNAKKSIELGTSLGLTTLYLAEHAGQVFTFEESHSLANIALTNFEYFDKKNINVIEGNIDTTLSNFLQDTAKINFVLIDSEPSYEKTVRYFNLLMRRVNEKSIIVVNNIHHSKEMDRAWQWLKTSEIVYGSIDLHTCGILFFEPSLNKQHFIFSLAKN